MDQWVSLDTRAVQDSKVSRATQEQLEMLEELELQVMICNLC